jgi:hypothetical protein
MTSCIHKMCGRIYGQTNMKRAITLEKINQMWNRYNMHMLRSWPIKIPNMNKNATKDKVFCHILFIFGILVGHDLSRCILYRFHGWLIFARVVALFMFVWPYVCLHILCTQLVSEIDIICACSDHGQSRYKIWIKCDKRQMTSCIHKMCERTHAHFIPISRIVDFCESYSPFHVCLIICPLAHLVYATSY